MENSVLMLGNQALARGAYEAGVRVAVAYPGTPSTEITQEAAKYDEIHAQWAPNEKVALETAIGASLGGARTLCCFKHVGMNVAADPLFTSSYMGVNAGLVIVVADDPGMHSSQNEQDSRYYARSAHLPMLEPSDSQEAVDFMKLAFEMSEKYDTPVVIRTTTRMAHSRGVVKTSARQDVPLREVVRNMRKNVMLPVNARGRHIVVEEREHTMADDANDMPINRIEWTEDRSVGVIASGIAYQYVKEAAPEIPVLKLGLVNPLPMELIQNFADGVQRLIVAEELEPIFEEQIKAAGIECEGKSLFSRQGEFSTLIVKNALSGEEENAAPVTDLPARPPVMCPGCPHRATFQVLSRLGVFVSGDIGCYTLGALPPASAMHCSVCMGSSIPVASGMERANPELAKNTVSVIGDSTFFHSGMTGLVDMVYNKTHGTLLILDNGTTGMTGHQDHPGTGRTLEGEYSPKVDFEKLARAVGVEHVFVVDPFDMKKLEQTIREELSRDAVSVIICRRPCALLPGMRKAPLCVDPDRCRSCGKCLKLGCPALENHGGRPVINETLCTGCGLCVRECAFGAISTEVEA